MPHYLRLTRLIRHTSRGDAQLRITPAYGLVPMVIALLRENVALTNGRFCQPFKFNLTFGYAWGIMCLAYFLEV